MAKYVVFAFVLIITLAAAQCGAPTPGTTLEAPSATPPSQETPVPPSPSPVPPTDTPIPPNPTPLPPTDTPVPPSPTPEQPVDTPVSSTPVVEEPATLDGQALLQARCVECHDLGRVERASKSKADWRLTVVRMVNTGAQLSNEELEFLVDYLSENYGQ
jgi:hypothetical protein